ncbi:glycosyltransferase [Polaribacter sp. WD7]|uniref:glycosyltransferase family 4 protein n=1 Tax=Polaribacter sp. WD7 TaxID=2269061 RepID=UPI000DF387E3|nr:glycosyltransferase family 4 protein [Polaribacter sp. WD7]RCS27694.1 glycosyltransferase [Polaribacter sp. WD7]
MKITVITSPFGLIPPHGYGAVERLWYNLSLEFVKKGHQVCFVAKKPQVTVQNKDNITIQYVKGYSWSGSFAINLCLDFVFSLKSLIKMNKTEILVMNTFWSPILSVFFSRKIKKTIYNVARYPKGQFKFYKHVNRLACVSKPVYDELIKQEPSLENQSKIISNPINTNVFKYHSKKESKNLRILYTGRVCEEKGLVILVEAFNNLIAKYPYIELALMGPRDVADGGGGELYINKLNTLASKFSIKWIDPTSDQQELCDEIVKSDIYCYPSIAEKGETFGVAPLEAMATGTPTIVSNLACFKDFVIDNTNALVFDHKASNRVNLLSKKIEILINNPEKRRNLGEKGVQKSLEFSNDIIAKEYLKDFSFLLNNK